MLLASQLDKCFEFLCLGDVGEVLLGLHAFVLGVADLPRLIGLGLVGSARLGGPIFEGEWLHLNGLLHILCVLQVEVQMLMDGLEIRHAMRNLRDESTVSDTASRCGPFSSSLLRQLILPLDHTLHSFRQIKLSIPVDDLLKNAFPALCLLLVDPAQQIHLAVPRHGSRHELVLLSTEVAVGLGGFGKHEVVRHVDLAHDFQSEPFESLLALPLLVFEELFIEIVLDMSWHFLESERLHGLLQFPLLLFQHFLQLLLPNGYLLALVPGIKREGCGYGDVELLIVRELVLTADLQDLVLLALDSLLPHDFVVLVVTRRRLEALPIFLQTALLLLLYYPQLALQVFNVDPVLNQLGPSPVGEEIQHFLKIEILVSLSIDADKCFLKGFLLDVSIALRTHIHALDAFVSRVCAQSLQEFLLQDEVFSELGSSLEDLLDDL